MSKSFEFDCDKCGVRADAKWNGEHWLPPADWVTLLDDKKNLSVDMHLCDDCDPLTPTKTTDV